MKLFALVDCNNFYASCERVFNPALENQPIAILSNNDGCIVARSNEVKALGIPMGIPVFKYKKTLQQHQVRLFSSNYTLYGDMSARVMGVLSQCVPKMEIYSIDEAFLDLSNFAHQDLTTFAQSISTKIKQYTGIPVSIGIGRTKTLAKVANRIAKESGENVFNLEAEINADRWLNQIAIAKVWGVGRSHSKSLPKLGIHNALDLKQYQPEVICQRYGVVLLRTVRELNGLSCIPLEEAPPAKKATAVTRSFSKPVREKKELLEAVVTYASRGAEKLRKAKQAAMIIRIFWRTGLFDSRQPIKSWSFTVDLREHTNDSRVFIQAVTKTVNQHFESGYKLKKAGIILSALVPETQIQRSLFSNQDETKTKKLMEVIDSINGHFGKETIKFAATGTKRQWVSKAELKSPRYTTKWSDIPIVKAGFV